MIDVTDLDQSKLDIKTVADILPFFNYLQTDLNVHFHPDDDFKDYVNDCPKDPAGNERTFTDAAADLLDAAMKHCFELCGSKNEGCWREEQENPDDLIYQIALQTDWCKTWAATQEPDEEPSYYQNPNFEFGLRDYEG